jgi:hypothetical protein
MDWNHRLNVDCRLRLIVGADIEIEIVLNRYADQVGDRVLRLLGQLAFISAFLVGLSFGRLVLLAQTNGGSSQYRQGQ